LFRLGDEGEGSVSSRGGCDVSQDSCHSFRIINPGGGRGRG
jgi:hypothetical protein